MGEIKSLHPYLPFQEELFDLVILDEASQVNLAEIFLFYLEQRGTALSEIITVRN